LNVIWLKKALKGARRIKIN